MNSYNEGREEMIKKETALWKTLTAGAVGKPSEKQVWTTKAEIIEILDNVGKHQASNYTFLPSGGSNELAGARISHEDGLIELHFDGSSRSATLAKPVSLTFHAVGDDPNWWYFRLETARFEPTDVYGSDSSSAELIPWSRQNEMLWSLQYGGEELVEVTPGNYVERYHWDSGQLGYDEDGNEIPLHRSARLIIRKHNGGAYAIFPKFSLYTQSGKFDRDHNKMNDAAFREYVEKIVASLERRK